MLLCFGSMLRLILKVGPCFVSLSVCVSPIQSAGAKSNLKYQIENEKYNTYSISRTVQIENEKYLRINVSKFIIVTKERKQLKKCSTERVIISNSRPSGWAQEIARRIHFSKMTILTWMLVIQHSAQPTVCFQTTSSRGFSNFTLKSSLTAQADLNSESSQKQILWRTFTILRSIWTILKSFSRIG